MLKGLKGLPKDLSDANQDGQVDEQDFVRGFANRRMNSWEIGQIFKIADFNKKGAIGIHEWKIFVEMFINRFDEADANHDLLIDESEFAKSLEDIPGLINFRKNAQLVKRLLNDISGDPNHEVLSVNFYEWLFIRQCASAWTVAAGSVDSITKNELIDIAKKITPH